jgi:uncharacterized protein YjbI with pentapeptide repeats
MTTENKLWLPPLSPKDQQKLDRLRRNGKKSTSNWTGFAGRTLWDWIQFYAVVAIPIIVAVGTLYFTQQITLQQAQLSISASDKQHQTDLQIANDQQQEATLKSYLDDMSDLLLNHNLRKSQPGDEVSQVARERTLTTLRRLKADRNQIVLQFLQDAHLISRENAVIDLRGANLSNDDLTGANLHDTDLGCITMASNESPCTNLSHADLNHANLFNADLSGAYPSPGTYNANAVDLSYANLSYANLSYANLSGDDLSGVDLRFINLSGANLSHTNLSGANLSGANLSHAKVTNEQLAQAKSLKGATMPNGSIHP